MSTAEHVYAAFIFDPIPGECIITNIRLTIIGVYDIIFFAGIAAARCP